MQRISNYIDGRLIEPIAGRFLDDVDPATGLVYAQVPDSDECDMNAAVEAARDAFESWSHTPVNDRAAVLNKIASLIDENLEELARAECIDNGKPLSLAKSLDIPRAATNFRFFASTIIGFHTECHATDDVAINYTLRKPRGVAGIISPWNLPLYLLTWKVAPALACGNTVVAKPSEITPMTALKLAELCIAAGLPPGVLNMVHGRGASAGAALVRHRDVPTISFTGSTKTGADIATAAAPMFKKVGLEMGGKNPNIIFADADLEEAVRGSLRSSFANQGQVCLCGSRMFVEAPIYEQFVGAFVAATGKMQTGDPLDESVNVGAIVSKAQHDKILSYIAMARADGGTIRCGGGRPTNLSDRCMEGYFIEPTVITNLPAGSRVDRDEIFGPVVTITPFDSEEQVIRLANDTAYGLSASVWTQNVGRAHRVADCIEAGTVWINSWLLRDLRVPFGGVKQSGVGREGGIDALRFYTEPKNICVKVPRL